MSDSSNPPPIKLVATCDTCGLPAPQLSSDKSSDFDIPGTSDSQEDSTLTLKSQAEDACKDCGQSPTEFEKRAQEEELQRDSNDKEQDLDSQEKKESLSNWLVKELNRDFKLNKLISKCKNYVALNVYDKSLDRNFVLKIFKKQSAKEVIKSSDLTMAELLASINHPHLQTVYESGFTSEGRLYILMEDPGEISFETIIKEDGFLDLPIALELFGQASEALYQLHQLNISHGSIRPRSFSVQEVSKGIFVTKVTNFSVTKISEDNLKQPTKIGRNYTCLDAFYMSPEELNSVDPDPLSEIYSLACVMFHTMTGKPVFRARNLKEAVKQHTDANKARFRRQYEIPENVQSVVLKMLEKLPEDRYENLDEVRKDVLNLQAGQKPKGSSLWDKIIKKVRNDQNK